MKLVRVGAEGKEQSADGMRSAKPDDLTDLANLSLTLAEGKRLLAGIQHEIAGAQVRVRAVHRPECRDGTGQPRLT